ncbi:MAG: KxYKxGKxW signal peptide domain-containing protein, partial [Lactobacillus sp.]|nr:KxYKxGKxW signal peptide domain-containing protein [Lactobacillus sp.]
MSKETNEARSRMMQATFERKEHFRLYKSGKLWVFAGIFALSTAIGLSQTNDVSAATTDQAPVATNTDKNNQASTVALQSAPAQSAASTAAPAGKTVTTAAKSATAAPAPAPAAADDTTAQDTTGTDNYAQSQKDLQDAANAANDAGLTVTKDPDATVDTTSDNVQADAQKVADSTADTIAQLQAATEKQKADNKAYEDSIATRQNALSGKAFDPLGNFTDDQVKGLLGDDIQNITVVHENVPAVAANDAAKQAETDGGSLEAGAQWIYKNSMVDAKTGRHVDLIETITDAQAIDPTSPMILQNTYTGEDGVGTNKHTSYNIKSITYNYQYVDSETGNPVSLDAFYDVTNLFTATLTFDNGDANANLYGPSVEASEDGDKQVFSIPVDNDQLTNDGYSSEVFVLQKNSQGTTFTVQSSNPK